MTDKQLEEVKIQSLELVNGNVLSKGTWPNHIIYDIILNNRDGKQVPHVVAKNQKNEKDMEYNMPLDTWLKENGY